MSAPATSDDDLDLASYASSDDLDTDADIDARLADFYHAIFGLAHECHILCRT
jgi:hypothetical protein